MCGICGVVGIESREASEPVVRRMMAAMVHRGPDEEGILARAAGRRRHAPPQHHRSCRAAASPSGTKPARSPSFTTARFTIFASCAPSSNPRATVFAPVPIPKWSCTPRKPGASLRRALPRHVCLRHRRNAAGPRRARCARLSRARSHGHQAALLRAGGWQIRFRLRSSRAPRERPVSRARISPEAIPAYLLFGSVCEPLTLIDGRFLASARPLDERSPPDRPRYACPRRSATGTPPTVGRSNLAGRECGLRERTRRVARRKPSNRT